MKNTVILGAGTAGLISAFYNENATVIDSNPLGQISGQYQLGPRIFKVDKYVKQFLQKVGVDFYIKKIDIGFTNNDKDMIEPDGTFRRRYSILTRRTEKVEKSFLSGGATSIEIFTDGSDDFFKKVFEKVLKKIIERGQLQKMTVTGLNTKDKEIHCDKGLFNYDELISTLNLKVLLKILDINEIKPKALKKHFVITRLENERDKELSKYFAYIYSTNGVYSRKTYVKDYIVYETLIPLSYIKDLENNKIIKIINNLPIQIVNSIDIRDIQGVQLLGRFAQWNHAVKTNEIIKYYELRK